jgi:hypothetical protein
MAKMALPELRTNLTTNVAARQVNPVSLTLFFAFTSSASW